MAKRAAADGANVVLLAKTTEPNPKLPGHAVQRRRGDRRRRRPGAAGARPTSATRARSAAAVQAAVERFGGIDILVNNASAISLTPTPATPMKRFDLMFGVNVRGTYCCTQACLPRADQERPGRAATRMC
ncbi:MAG: SDR family NAD(P)-dependent oxidoreductase [Comamonadaceae bacterium]|nr:SDR family NAD(P)-dependent oxidoreductase [Comamonadaceae bacterium]